METWRYLKAKNEDYGWNRYSSREKGNEALIIIFLDCAEIDDFEHCSGASCHLYSAISGICGCLASVPNTKANLPLNYFYLFVGGSELRDIGTCGFLPARQIIRSGPGQQNLRSCHVRG
ncbi:unnamed protein product [Allacma fusca]|uniref:Uncharacterized protein n=1 Tax=Allacma fusca TaxID=39272 RepID=A0A8J2L503_9HEXA|nr:unnamed protein product [Allacma fusca]